MEGDPMIRNGRRAPGLVCDKKERKLIEYRGVSNLFDGNEDLWEVTITYSDNP
jgi:hypothetical protein